jgi:hypothetical protein
MSALLPKATLIGAHLGLLMLHHNLGSDRHAAVEVGNVLVDHAEASRRHSLADRLRRIGAVDAIHGRANIERTCAKRQDQSVPSSTLDLCG